MKLVKFANSVIFLIELSAKYKLANETCEAFYIWKVISCRETEPIK